MALARVTDVSAHRRKTPLRTLQVDDAPWAAFEDAARTAGTTRPDAVREFIGWMNHSPELWRDVRAEAERRGETMRAVVERQLRAYLKQE